MEYFQLISKEGDPKFFLILITLIIYKIVATIDFNGKFIKFLLVNIYFINYLMNVYSFNIISFSFLTSYNGFWNCSSKSLLYLK